MKKILFLAVLAISFNVVAQNKTVVPKKSPIDPGFSFLIFDHARQQIVAENNAEKIRPMASITKLMTAMVTLDQNPNLNSQVKDLAPKDPFREYTIKDVLGYMLVSSSNFAAETLSRLHGSRDTFIQKMNIKAGEIGMYSSRFADPSGISSDNLANAYDLAKLLAASGRYETIREIANLQQFPVTVEKRTKPSILTVYHTNRDILREFKDIVISKTGTTSQAGHCLALLVEQHGHQYAVILLGLANRELRDYSARTLLKNKLSIYEILTGAQ